MRGEGAELQSTGWSRMYTLILYTIVSNPTTLDTQLRSVNYFNPVKVNSIIKIGLNSK